jgi:hypothetical protein
MPPRKSLDGNLLRIQFGPTQFGFGRIISSRDGFFEFYDAQSSSPDTVPSEPLRALPVLFTVCLHKSWTQRAGWDVIGRDQEALPAIPPQFMQGPEPGANIRIVAHDGTVRGGSCDEVLALGIERLAVWEDDHVEDRLRDHFAGRPCVWTQQLAPRPT